MYIQSSHSLFSCGGSQIQVCLWQVFRSRSNNDQVSRLHNRKENKLVGKCVKPLWWMQKLFFFKALQVHSMVHLSLSSTIVQLRSWSSAEYTGTGRQLLPSTTVVHTENVWATKVFFVFEERTPLLLLHLFCYPHPSLQIIFCYKPVICQVRDKVWPDMHAATLFRQKKLMFPNLFNGLPVADHFINCPASHFHCA